MSRLSWWDGAWWLSDDREPCSSGVRFSASELADLFDDTYPIFMAKVADREDTQVGLTVDRPGYAPEAQPFPFEGTLEEWNACFAATVANK